MPEPYVRAQRARQTKGIIEYGPIDSFAAPDDHAPASAPAAPAPASTMTPPSAPKPIPDPPSHQLENTPMRSKALPRASQPFPLPSPEPYSPPRSLQYDDEAALTSDDESFLPDISELLAKTRPQSQRDPNNSPQAVKSSSASSQVTSTSAKKVHKPAVFANPQGKTSSAAASLPNLRSPTKSLAVPSSTSKGKRKAELIKTQSSPKCWEPLAKRSKPNSNQPRKHDKFWHLDGNIVINIANTHFKLHRSRLAEQSQYFSGIFELNDGVEFLDGRPVYTVTSVSVKDFEILLHCFGRRYV